MGKRDITGEKTICFIFTLFFFIHSTHAQKKIVTQKGEISFVSDAPLETIKAVTTKIAGVIDPASNQFSFIVQVGSFKGFNSDLQREHFNENYLETEKYPTASFNGKIIEQIDFGVDSIYEIRAKGELDIHGLKQIRIIKSKMTVKNNSVNIETRFSVALTDHNISVPRIVSQKIASEIQIKMVAFMVRQ